MKVQVPEFKIKQAVEFYRQMADGVPENYLRVLDAGATFRAANLHPFYIFDDDVGTFQVTSQEHVENRGN